METKRSKWTDPADTVDLVRRMDVYLILLDMESDRFARLDRSEVLDAIDAHEAREAREGI